MEMRTVMIARVKKLAVAVAVRHDYNDDPCCQECVRQGARLAAGMRTVKARSPKPAGELRLNNSRNCLALVKHCQRSWFMLKSIAQPPHLFAVHTQCIRNTYAIHTQYTATHPLLLAVFGFLSPTHG